MAEIAPIAALPAHISRFNTPCFVLASNAETNTATPPGAPSDKQHAVCRGAGQELKSQNRGSKSAQPQRHLIGRLILLWLARHLGRYIRYCSKVGFDGKPFGRLREGLKSLWRGRESRGQNQGFFAMNCSDDTHILYMAVPSSLMAWSRLDAWLNEFGV
jgi:hypothetical protein